MTVRITILCDEPVEDGLCGQRRMSATSAKVSLGEAMVLAVTAIKAEGWLPRREGGWRCPGRHDR